MTTRDKELSKESAPSASEQEENHTWVVAASWNDKAEKDSPGRAKSQSTLRLADMYKHRDVDVTPIVNIYFYRDNFRILNKAVHIFRLASQSICSLFFYDWTKGSIY